MRTSTCFLTRPGWILIGERERELSESPVTFDPDYTTKLRKVFQDEPIDAVMIAMTQTAEDLPEPFSFGAEVAGPSD